MSVRLADVGPSASAFCARRWVRPYCGSGHGSGWYMGRKTGLAHADETGISSGSLGAGT
jgi:hypothetical protein